MTIQRLDLGLTSAPAAACCGGDGYSCDIPAYAAESTITELNVDGMTCDHCVRAVTDELSALDGVDEVSVALKPGGTSRVVVRGSSALGSDVASAAIERAGYTLAG
jgi:copper chaperone CopZ